MKLLRLGLLMMLGIFQDSKAALFESAHYELFAREFIRNNQQCSQQPFKDLCASFIKARYFCMLPSNAPLDLDSEESSIPASRWSCSFASLDMWEDQKREAVKLFTYYKNWIAASVAFSVKNNYSEKSTIVTHEVTSLLFPSPSKISIKPITYKDGFDFLKNDQGISPMKMQQVLLEEERAYHEAFLRINNNIRFLYRWSVPSDCSIM